MPEQPRGTAGRIFAVVGAESTGKSTLAEALALRLADDTGLSCTWVPETLREWCAREARTPRIDEQAAIADEQARRIDAAAATHDLVIADTTPLMTAVYQRQVFADRSLDAAALRWQRRCHLTLLTALDLPWQADGLQRDGPQVQVPVDSALRELLRIGDLPYAVVAGSGSRRLDSALDAIGGALRHLRAPRDGLQRRLLQRDAERAASESAWRGVCNNCDAPDCEHAAFRLRRVASLQGD